MIYVLETKTHVDKIPSENFLYHPKVGKSGKRVWAYLYKDESVEEYQSKIEEIFKDKYADEIFPIKEEIKFIIGGFLFYVRESMFWERDVTNMLKASEDAIFRSIDGLDDSMVINNFIKKIKISDEEKYETVVTKHIVSLQQTISFDEIIEQFRMFI